MTKRLGFPSSSVGKESACNAGDPGSVPRLRRSPGERNATHSVSLPEEFHEQRSLAGYSPHGHKKLDTTEWLTHTLGPYTAGKLVFSENTVTNLYPHEKKKKKKMNPHADLYPSQKFKLELCKCKVLNHESPRRQQRRNASWPLVYQWLFR